MVNTLFKTDAEVAEALGVTTEEFKGTLAKLEKSGFPSKDIFFQNRRYMPAVKTFFDRWYDIDKPGGGANRPDGKENWD